MKKKLVFITLVLLSAINLRAQTQEPPSFWENEIINEQNREPMHATYFAYENKELAIRDDKQQSKYFQKHNHHSGELKERDMTVFNIDLEQTGVGGINSWGSWPLKQYRLDYKDYSYSFTIAPVK